MLLTLQSYKKLAFCNLLFKAEYLQIYFGTFFYLIVTFKTNLRSCQLPMVADISWFRFNSREKNLLTLFLLLNEVSSEHTVE